MAGALSGARPTWRNIQSCLRQVGRRCGSMAASPATTSQRMTQSFNGRIGERYGPTGILKTWTATETLCGVSPSNSILETEMEQQSILAWWFAASDVLPHGDGRKIILGESHKLDGAIVLCEHALHGSIHPMDALVYAPGPYLYRTEHSGVIEKDHDKIGSSTRAYLDRRDMTEPLRRFARKEALSVTHLCKSPAVVRLYLETGDETLREAASAAAWEAAWEAARAAASAAAWPAASAAVSAAV